MLKTSNKNQGKNTRTTNMHSSEQKNNINDKFQNNLNKFKNFNLIYNNTNFL